VLSLAWERAGGVEEAVDVSRSPHRLEPVSATFHGRDVFAPVAAHLATGAELRDAGDPLDTAQLERLTLPEARVEDGAVLAHALVVDGFGNVSLDLRHDHLIELGLTIGARTTVEAGIRRREATFVQTFADVPAGDLLIYEDAWGAVALGVNRGDAARELGLAPDDELRIAPAS
jgi:S-adenosylmethionine hydrolase